MTPIARALIAVKEYEKATDAWLRAINENDGYRIDAARERRNRARSARDAALLAAEKERRTSALTSASS